MPSDRQPIITLEDVKAASPERLKDMLEEIERRQMEVANQLSEAKTRFRITGEAADPVWFAKARAAMRHFNFIHSAISRRLKDLERMTWEENKKLQWYRSFYFAVVQNISPELLNTIKTETTNSVGFEIKESEA